MSFTVPSKGPNPCTTRRLQGKCSRKIYLMLHNTLVSLLEAHVRANGWHAGDRVVVRNGDEQHLGKHGTVEVSAGRPHEIEKVTLESTDGPPSEVAFTGAQQAKAQEVKNKLNAAPRQKFHRRILESCLQNNGMMKEQIGYVSPPEQRRFVT